MLSLPPRYDLFRVTFTKDFLGDEIKEQFSTLLSRNQGVVQDPIEYLNESIIGCSFPGINDLTINSSDTWFGTEPDWATAKNPLACITKEFKIDFRMNQGCYNYFMIFEELMHCHYVNITKNYKDAIVLYLLDETGSINRTIQFKDCYIKSLDKLSFSFSKLERQSEQFSVNFAFNAIQID